MRVATNMKISPSLIRSNRQFPVMYLHRKHRVAGATESQRLCAVSWYGYCCVEDTYNKPPGRQTSKLGLKIHPSNILLTAEANTTTANRRCIRRRKTVCMYFHKKDIGVIVAGVSVYVDLVISLDTDAARDRRERDEQRVKAPFLISRQSLHAHSCCLLFATIEGS